MVQVKDLTELELEDLWREVKEDEVDVTVNFWSVEPRVAIQIIPPVP